MYIDIKEKKLKLIKVSENKVNFTANFELLKKPATLEEELNFILIDKG